MTLTPIQAMQSAAKALGERAALCFPDAGGTAVGGGRASVCRDLAVLSQVQARRELTNQLADTQVRLQQRWSQSQKTEVTTSKWMIQSWCWNEGMKQATA